MTHDAGRVSPVERVALGGVLAALAAAAGFALVGVPNVELVTLVVFVSGYTYGRSLGAAVGVVGEGIFSVANPLGAAPPQVLLGQVAGMALAGVFGGVASRLPHPRSRALRAVAFGCWGLAATLAYHVTTDLASVAVIRVTPAYLLAGIPFYVVHVTSNTALFALCVPAVVDRISARFGRAG